MERVNRCVILSYRCSRYLLVIVTAAGLAWLTPGSLSKPQAAQVAAAASDPVIAAAGDIACDPSNSVFNGGLGSSGACRQKYTSDLLVNAGLAAVLDLGDNQYYCGGYQAYLQSYDLSWGRIKSITHPSVGNHEYLTSGGTGCDITNEGATGYFQYFGAAAGTPGQGYYSFDVGAWHIIALNSNCGDIGGCTSSSAEYQWLQSDLAAHPNFCTLAFWHIPLFSSGGRSASNSKPFWQLLYDNNADLILNGHDHIYERFAPQNPSAVLDTARGIRELIVGSGGANHTTIVSIAPNSEVRNVDTYGVVKLTLHPTGYDWQFVPEAGKTFTDSGTGACHGSSSNTPTPTSTSAPTFTATATSTGTPTPTAGQYAMFVPGADTFVNSANPTTNYGAMSTLRPDGSPDARGYLRFTVQGLGGMPVTRARLSLFANSSASSGIGARAVSDNSWGELTTNYNNAPAPGSLLASSGALTLGTWVTLDVTSYVTAEGTYSFAVTTPGSTAISLAARESGANAPELILDLGATPASPTPTGTAAASSTATLSPTNTAIPTSTVLPTASLTATPAPTFTATIAAPSSTSTAPPTDTPTLTPTALMTDTPSPTNTPADTATTTPTTQPLAPFSDGFESGSLSQWTVVKGLVVQSQEVAGGTFAARGTSAAGGAAYARLQLGSAQSDLYYLIEFKIVSQGANTVNLMKFRTAADAPIVSISVSNAGVLAYRNDVTGTSVNSTVGVSPGSWQTLEVHVRVEDAASRIEVWYNGAPVSVLTRVDALGTNPIGRLQLGENTSGLTYDIAFDNVVTSSGFIAESSTVPLALAPVHIAIAPVMSFIAWRANRLGAFRADEDSITCLDQRSLLCTTPLSPRVLSIED